MQSLPDPTHSAGGHSTDIARCSPEARSDDDTVAARRQQEFEQSPRHARGSNCGGVTVEVHDRIGHQVDKHLGGKPQLLRCEPDKVATHCRVISNNEHAPWCFSLHRAPGPSACGVCGRFITNRSARASKYHHCIFGLQTSPTAPDPGVPAAVNYSVLN